MRLFGAWLPILAVFLLHVCCRARLSGLQRVFVLSDAEVSKLFPYLTVLLAYDPEQHIRPRWHRYQALLGEWAACLRAVLAVWLDHVPCFLELQASLRLLRSGASSPARVHCDYLSPPLEMYSPGWSS
jgi:hypothetical protein